MLRIVYMWPIYYISNSHRITTCKLLCMKDLLFGLILLAAGNWILFVLEPNLDSESNSKHAALGLGRWIRCFKLSMSAYLITFSL